ncbi:MAG: pantetheine-phosphate adenylyltransferase [Phycisphaeraceae bacterium]|nr:pantetheine-phosphate adenylyltransferase [Phycisphaeraceae bacterium]
MNQPSRIGLFPGTFDPITNGHVDVIRRGRHLFDTLVVGVGQNPAKKAMFTLDDRVKIIRDLVEQAGMNNVQVDRYHGLTVDFARGIGATAILRSLRNVSDLAFEFQLALTNRAVADVETVFIMTAETHAFTSSTLIRQIASEGPIDRLHRLVPPGVLAKLKELQKQHGGKIPWPLIDPIDE